MLRGRISSEAFDIRPTTSIGAVLVTTLNVAIYGFVESFPDSRGSRQVVRPLSNSESAIALCPACFMFLAFVGFLLVSSSRKMHKA